MDTHTETIGDFECTVATDTGEIVKAPYGFWEVWPALERAGLIHSKGYGAGTFNTFGFFVVRPPETDLLAECQRVGPGEIIPDGEFPPTTDKRF